MQHMETPESTSLQHMWLLHGKASDLTSYTVVPVSLPMGHGKLKAGSSHYYHIRLLKDKRISELFVM